MTRLLPWALVAALCVAVPASAQSVWLDREHRPSVLAEVLFPSFDESSTNFPTWTWFLTGKLPAGPTGAVVLELPYAHGDFGEEPFNVSEGAVGNPYLGYEYRPHPSGLLLEAGARLPLASDNKLAPFITGFFSDLDREEAFVPDIVPVRLGLHYHHAPSGATPVSWDLRLVPSVWIETDNTLIDETEVFFGYGGTLRYEGEDVRLGGGLAGRWNASANGADFGQASNHQLDLEADFLRGKIRPGVQLKLPLDEGLTDVLQTSWGFTLTVLP